MVISLSFYTFAAKRIYNIGIYGNTVQKAPNVYFPREMDIIREILMI